jgi:protein-arginine deiminase
MSSPAPPLTVRADWDHAGRLTDRRPASTDAFVIVPLAPPSGGTAFRTPAALEFETPGPVTVSIEEAGARGRIHLYERDDGSGWAHRGPGGTWSLNRHTDSRREIALAAVPPTPGDRAAYANTFTLRIADEEGRIATVPCRVAPVLLASSLDPVDEVLVIRNPLTARFADELARLVPKASGRPKVRFVDHTAVPHDLWIQDAVEIGRVCVPGGPPGSARQSVAPLLGLRARHDGIRTASLDTFVAEHFARTMPEAVCIQPAAPRPDTRWIDWYGNLEVSPPVKGFPHGRVLTGEQKGLTIHPDLLAFLEAQGFQMPPLFLDVGWLTIGHVDETINFVPARDRLGFRALLPSPALARDLLEQTVKAGHGDAPVFAGHKSMTTAALLLDEVGRSRETDAIEAVLRDTRARLRDGLGVEAADILELPVLFKNGLAVVPNGVNSLIVGRDVFVPDPAGPSVDGEDVFRRAIRERLAPLGLRLHFMDIYEPYHVRSGEIHCGTNAIRRLASPRWWDQSKKAARDAIVAGL